jgi:hypothetical protein
MIGTLARSVIAYRLAGSSFYGSGYWGKNGTSGGGVAPTLYMATANLLDTYLWTNFGTIGTLQYGSINIQRGGLYGTISNGTVLANPTNSIEFVALRNDIPFFPTPPLYRIDFPLSGSSLGITGSGTLNIYGYMGFKASPLGDSGIDIWGTQIKDALLDELLVAGTDRVGSFGGLSFVNFNSISLTDTRGRFPETDLIIQTNSIASETSVATLVFLGYNAATISPQYDTMVFHAWLLENGTLHSRPVGTLRTYYSDSGQVVDVGFAWPTFDVSGTIIATIFISS